MDQENGKQITGQGFGSPEPVGVGSERVGSSRPPSSDHSVPATIDQVEAQSKVTGIEERKTLFSQHPRIQRTPPKKIIAVSKTKDTTPQIKEKTNRTTPKESMTESKIKDTIPQTKEKNPACCSDLKLENKKLLDRVNRIELEFNKQKIEIQKLRVENEELRKEQSSFSQKYMTETIPVVNTEDVITSDDELYYTDSSEFESKSPTGQIKRKANFSPEDLTKQQTRISSSEVIGNKEKRQKTLNSPLIPIGREKQKNNLKDQTGKRPPPIYVEKITNHKTFAEKIEKGLTKNSYTYKTLKNNTVKVSCFTDIAYRMAIAVLQESSYSYHTYENKQKRPIRVMAKGLHHSWPTDDVVADLKDKGFNAESAINKLSWKEKKPLDMFILSFHNTENVESVHKITHILNTKVEIHPMKGNKMIPQCKKCQAFEHTQSYCMRSPRCVKCAGNHLTKDCIKPKDRGPTCANCNGSHPASYRGCEVAKQLQEIRNKQNKVKRADEDVPKVNNQKLANKENEMQKVNHIAQNVDKEVQESTSSQQLSYSSVTKEKTPTTNPVEKMIQTIISKLDRLENQYTSINQRLKKLEYLPRPGRKSKPKKL